MEPMTVAVAIHARFFARLREQAGTDSETVHVPQRSTVGDVYAALRGAHPALESNLEDTVVGEGDEVAFIPPVSGGANTVPGVPANSCRRL